MEVTMDEPTSDPELIDYATVPVIAGLSSATRTLLCSNLNDVKCLPTDEGLPKDWRGLAHLIRLRVGEVPNTERDPTAKVLQLWNSKFRETCYIAQLQSHLQQLDRWDVFDDTKDLIEEDARKYVSLAKESVQAAPSVNLEVDNEILTRHDESRLSQGLDTQHYDAFILFAEADIAFATELMTNLEDNYNLKLCAKNRDLVGGHVFEHSAIMRLISERCNRLVIVVTQAFLESSHLKFFLSFAQALGIKQQERKMVPIVLERCDQLPLELQYCYKLDCTNTFGKYNIWEKLYQSIKTTIPPVMQCRQPIKVEPANTMSSVERPKSESSTTETDGRLDNHTPQTVTTSSDKVVTFNENITPGAVVMPPLPAKRPVQNWFKKFVHKKEKNTKASHEKNVIKKSWKQRLAVLN